jgi:four helix bundle protein
MKIRTYRDLTVWQKSMDLVVACYQASEAFPNEEIYGLTAQLRRAAVSVPSNIAEGKGRRGNNEFANFLSIASGSLAELITQIEIARRLDYLSDEVTAALHERAEEVSKMLSGLYTSLKQRRKDRGTTSSVSHDDLFTDA